MNVIPGISASVTAPQEVNKKTSSKPYTIGVCVAISVSSFITPHNMKLANAINPIYLVEYCDSQQQTQDFGSDFVLIKSGGARMPQEYYKNKIALNQIAALPNNWNNNGANTFSPQLISRSQHLIERLQKQPMIFPTANDSIQFEYEKDNGDYLEFELFENGKCKLFHCGTDNTHECRFIDDADINKEVNQFYGRPI